MTYKKLHEWDLSPEEAMKIQNVLREKILFKPFEGEPKYVAGG